MVYAVIDTNVLVSAIFAAHPDSATVIVRDKIMDGTIVPLYNAEIFDEYRLPTSVAGKSLTAKVLIKTATG